jgi:hypothetical protein
MLHTHLSSPATSSVLELAPGWVRTAHVRAPSACSTLLAQHMFILVNDVHDLVVLSSDGTSEILFLKQYVDIFRSILVEYQLPRILDNLKHTLPPMLQHPFHSQFKFEHILCKSCPPVLLVRRLFKVFR